MQAGHQVHALLVRRATQDLEAGSAVRPCLAGLRGGQALLVAGLRPFARGAYRQPLLEVLALARLLRADSLALSIAGRAWSLADPVPPVLAHGPDLRQRVLVVEEAQAGTGEAAGAARSTSTLLAYRLTAAGRVVWSPAVDAGRAEGWIPAALRAVVGNPAAGTAAAVGAQAARCAALGHDLDLAPGVTAQPPARSG